MSKTEYTFALLILLLSLVQDVEPKSYLVKTKDGPQAMRKADHKVNFGDYNDKEREYGSDYRLEFQEVCHCKY